MTGFILLSSQALHLEDVLAFTDHSKLIRLTIEGRTPAEIKAERVEQGLPNWDIWTEGCPGGE